MTTAALASASMAEPAAPRAASDDPLREQLLDAAAQVFAAKGYAGTKIMDIVKAAGLSSGAVYGRFASKDELLLAAVLQQVERNAHSRALEGQTVAHVLAQSSQASGALSDAEATELEAFIAARRNPHISKAITKARRRFRKTFGDAVVRQAIADGSASPDADFDSIIYFLETLRLGLLVQRAAGQPAPSDDAWQANLERILRFMANPPEAGA